MVYTIDHLAEHAADAHLDTINIIISTEGEDFSMAGKDLIKKHEAHVIIAIAKDNSINVFKNRFGNLMPNQTIQDIIDLGRHIIPENRDSWQKELLETYERKILLRDMKPKDRDFYNQIGIEE